MSVTFNGEDRKEISSTSERTVSNLTMQAHPFPKEQTELEARHWCRKSECRARLDASTFRRTAGKDALTFGYTYSAEALGAARDPNIRIHCRRHVTSNQPALCQRVDRWRRWTRRTHVHA